MLSQRPVFGRNNEGSSYIGDICKWMKNKKEWSRELLKNVWLVLSKSALSFEFPIEIPAAFPMPLVHQNTTIKIFACYFDNDSYLLRGGSHLLPPIQLKYEQGCPHEISQWSLSTRCAWWVGDMESLSKCHV